jgi:hypothetical protein
MAVEERKFTSTVVVTANRDTVLLGGRGTRRERKLPQRYQAAVASHRNVSCKSIENVLEDACGWIAVFCGFETIQVVPFPDPDPSLSNQAN